MTIEHTDWAMGAIVGATTFVLLTLIALVILAINLTRLIFDDGYNNHFVRDGWKVWATVSAVALVIIIVFGVWGTFPWEKQYHAYAEVQGTVLQADARLLPSGDSMEEKIVILYEESSMQFGCEDTRCASVRPGDHLTLACIRVWDLNATDGYDCKFRALEKGGA